MRKVQDPTMKFKPFERVKPSVFWLKILFSLFFALTYWEKYGQKMNDYVPDFSS
jgi:hypothetical protein